MAYPDAGDYEIGVTSGVYMTVYALMTNEYVTIDADTSHCEERDNATDDAYASQSRAQPLSACVHYVTVRHA